MTDRTPRAAKNPTVPKSTAAPAAPAPTASLNKPISNICVYCGSGPGKSPSYIRAANTLGKTLAARGIGLVYGGGSLGLMGEVARGVLSAGGRVTGIIPQFLSGREPLLRD